MGISEPKIRYTILEKKALSHTVISQWRFFVLFFWLKRHLTAGAKQEGGGGVQKIIPLPPPKKMLSVPLPTPAEKKVLTLLSASVERFGVSCIRDFFINEG